MSTRLRTWATTGHYGEDGDVVIDEAFLAARRTAAWKENAAVVALVPVGMLVGALFAVAFAARLVSTPFTRPANRGDAD